jgi:hypothetical protein
MLAAIEAAPVVTAFTFQTNANIYQPLFFELGGLPPRAPELNSQENIWQFMRQNWLSNRIFRSFDVCVPKIRITHRRKDQTR